MTHYLDFANLDLWTIFSPPLESSLPGSYINIFSMQWYHCEWEGKGCYYS